MSLQLDTELCGKAMPRCGVLVVKNPPVGGASQVPGILGMNIIRQSYQQLFGQYGVFLFDLSPVADAPVSIVQALQKCHRAGALHLFQVGSKCEAGSLVVSRVA